MTEKTVLAKIINLEISKGVIGSDFLDSINVVIHLESDGKEMCLVLSPTDHCSIIDGQSNFNHLELASRYITELLAITRSGSFSDCISKSVRLKFLDDGRISEIGNEITDNWFSPNSVSTFDRKDHFERVKQVFDHQVQNKG